MTDFDSHHIGLQQPSAPPQQETDTHLHNQPAPDVTSTQPSSSFTATTSPVQSPTSRQQAAHADSNASAPDASAPQTSQQQDGADGALSSPPRQAFDQAGAAVFPQQPSGQSQTSTAASTLQAAGQQAEQEPSVSVSEAEAGSNVSASEAADAFNQQQASGSDPVYPPPPSTSQQPQTAQQPSVDARGETPSYTPADAEHTGQTHMPSTESAPAQHQQEAETVSAAPHTLVSNKTQAGADSAGAPQASRTQEGQAASEQKVQSSSAPADIEQQNKHFVAAAAAEGQRPDVSSPAASGSQYTGSSRLHGAVGPATDMPEADQLSEAVASSSDGAKQPVKETERGADFPAGPIGETQCPVLACR